MDCFIVPKWDGFQLCFGCKYTHFFDFATTVLSDENNMRVKLVICCILYFFSDAWAICQ